jgi:hypothetical protein
VQDFDCGVLGSVLLHREMFGQLASLDPYFECLGEF